MAVKGCEHQLAVGCQEGTPNVTFKLMDVE